MADLVIVGFASDSLREKGVDLLIQHPSLRDVLYLCDEERIPIE